MNDLKNPGVESVCPSPAALRKMPADERAAILAAQAAHAELYYREDRQLTEFEAFGEDDLHDDGCSTEEG